MCKVFSKNHTLGFNTTLNEKIKSPHLAWSTYNKLSLAKLFALLETSDGHFDFFLGSKMPIYNTFESGGLVQIVTFPCEIKLCIPRSVIVWTFVHVDVSV